jgi:hypothetical protein
MPSGERRNPVDSYGLGVTGPKTVLAVCGYGRRECARLGSKAVRGLSDPQCRLTCFSPQAKCDSKTIRPVRAF